MVEENVVLVGRKALMNYVLSVNTMAMRGAKKIVLKARGRAISRAVDIEEMVLRRFLPEWEMESVNFDTQQQTIDFMKDRETGKETKLAEPRTRNVSTIEIVLSKTKSSKKDGTKDGI